MIKIRLKQSQDKPNLTTPKVLVQGLTKVNNPSDELSGLQIAQPVDSKHYKAAIKKLEKKTNFFNKGLTGSLVLLISGLLFFSLAGVNLYAQNKENLQINNIQKCNNLINLSKSRGIDIANLSCQAVTGWNNLLGDDESELVLNKVQLELDQKEQNYKNKIIKLDFQIADLSKTLNYFTSKEKWSVDLPVIDENNNIGQEINFKQNILLPKLEQLKIKYYSDLLDKINNYNKVITDNLDVNWSEEKIFIDDFKSLSESKQIEKFTELSIKRQALDEKLTKFLNQKNIVTNYKSYKIESTDLIKYKYFSGIDFQKLYEQTNYLNSINSFSSVKITSDSIADQKIISIAEKRGYKRRPELSQSLISVEGQMLEKQTNDSYIAMKQAAKKDGINIGLISGFRSAESQKGLFTSRFQSESAKRIGREYSLDEIKSGQADEAINEILKTSSIPGYSKHHTGYTMDFTDPSSGKSFTSFSSTPAYQWLSDNNFYNAKRFGIIPSYPIGGQNYGPDPEAWEFVWVGQDKLKN